MFETFNWPMAGVVLGIVFLFVFRKPIGEIIPRLKKLPGGAELAPENQQVLPVDESRTIATHADVSKSPFVTAQEYNILHDPRLMAIRDPAQRERGLVTSLAMAQIQIRFERIYTVIWGSQVAALRHLNSQPFTTVELVKPFYEKYRSLFPAGVEPGSFDQWLMYLTSAGLISLQNQTLSITPAGREFLVFMVQTNKSDPTMG